ncbi:MAG: MFS transporter [Caulobacteraceae bacterium]
MTAHAPAAVDDPPPTPAAPPAAGAWPSAGKAWWCVVMLSIVLMLSQIDRGIITLLVAPIKRDLHLSDVQISLLLGPAFILFYVFMGLPLSRLTDVRSRRVMIACGLTFWSVMTAMCGAAQGFWQLFWARVGIGAGESVNGPATYSMLADYFPRERLPRALAALNVGFIAGGGFSLVAGGLIIGGLSHVADVAVPWGVLHSWQLVFVVVGAPGLLFALLMMTVAEPARRGLMAGGPRPKAAPLREVVRYLVVNRRLYGCMIGAAAVSSLMAAGVQNWGPTFYQRTYGWAPSRIGVVQGTMALFVSPLGLIIGTWLCERLHRRRDDTNLLVVVIAYTIAIPFQVLGPLMPSAWLAIACSESAESAA